MELTPIAHVASPFATKFGVPRQPGLAPSVRGRVVFEPAFRNPDMTRGLDGFSHIWLIWQFSENPTTTWHPTVRPPRLGGNRRLGVLATRSPFRPNPLGLSCVELIALHDDPHLGPVLEIGGADLVDGTPVLDIKPYVGADMHPDARLGFTTDHPDHRVDVEIPDELLARIPVTQRASLTEVLAQDPRPAYQRDATRRYGVEFAGLDVTFVVVNGHLRVTGVVELPRPSTHSPASFD